MALGTPKPVFFISHSSAGLPATDRTVEIRDALAIELEARGWDVFLDREVIAAGDRWRTNIVYGLARANAAVILFNERAISSSDWVTAEALILCFHKSVDLRFQLIPVMLEAKSLQDTAFAKYQPYELNQIQAFADDAALSPGEVAARLAGKFDIERAQTVRSPWCERVHLVVSQLRRTPLERTAARLKLKLDARTSIQPDDVACEWLSNAIVTTMHHADPLDVINSLQDILLSLDGSQCLSLKKSVLAKWVPNESVELLMSATRRRGQMGVLTVGNMAAMAVDQYVNRLKIELYGRVVAWTFSVSAATGDSDDAIVAHVENTIRENIVSGPFLDDSAARLPIPQEVAEAMTDPTDVAICVLPPSCVRETVLRRLITDYPQIVFVAQAGIAGDWNPVTGLRTTPLTPPLNIQRCNQLSMLASRIDAALKAVNLD